MWFFLWLQNYQESVPQDLPTGQEVMRISATDIDDGNNSRVVYDLNPRVPDDAKYFHIDKTTGVIVLDRPIDVSISTVMIHLFFIFYCLWHIIFCTLFTSDLEQIIVLIAVSNVFRELK